MSKSATPKVANKSTEQANQNLCSLPKSSPLATPTLGRTPHPSFAPLSSQNPPSPLGKVRYSANIFYNNMNCLCFAAGDKTVGAIHHLYGALPEI